MNESGQNNGLESSDCPLAPHQYPIQDFQQFVASLTKASFVPALTSQEVFNPQLPSAQGLQGIQENFSGIVINGQSNLSDEVLVPRGILDSHNGCDESFNKLTVAELESHLQNPHLYSVKEAYNPRQSDQDWGVYHNMENVGHHPPSLISQKSPFVEMNAPYHYSAQNPTADYRLIPWDVWPPWHFYPPDWSPFRAVSSDERLAVWPCRVLTPASLMEDLPVIPQSFGQLNWSLVGANIRLELQKMANEN